MKKLLLFGFSILIVSCATFKVPYSQVSGMIDYSFLTKKGLFVTESNSVNFNYEPVGSIYASMYSGYAPKQKQATKTNDDIYPQADPGIVLSNEFRPATVNKALELVYQQAINCDANAIINLKINFIPAQYAQNGLLIKGEGIAISGMAVKK